MSGTYVYGESRRRAGRPAARPANPAPTAAGRRPCRTPTSPHPARPTADGERLHWYLADGGTGRMRVEEWTCASCRDTSYEYGVLGGAYRIRRTVRRDGRVFSVHESPAVRRTVAARWWQDLLTGRAV